MFQSEVNAGRDKGWSKDQAADLHVETGGAEWVAVHQDPSHVADGFGECAQAERDHEGPCSPSDALNELGHQGDTEEGTEESIGAQARVVAVDCAFDRTLWGHLGAEIRGGRSNHFGEAGDVCVGM